MSTPTDEITREAPLTVTQQGPGDAEPGLTIVWHPDPGRVGERLPLRGPVALARGEPDFVHPNGQPTAPLADPFVSRRPLTLRPERGGVTLDPMAARLKIDGEPCTEPRHISAEALRRGVVLELARRVVMTLGLIPVAPAQEDERLVGQSLAMTRLRQAITRAAPAEVPLLIRGESGTGKELVARAVHQASDRRHGPYQVVNMAAVPPSVAASAFFGHAKGAFTGAAEASKGYFGEADGGTLFLDEIGDLPLELQPLVLRALESGEVQPVGARRPHTVDVRIIAATDQDLDAAIEAGTFRLPLLHRLQGLPILLPPLRDRREDIGLLLLSFLRSELETLGALHRLDPTTERPWLSARRMARLVCGHWPGNVRQLRNVARQLALSFHDQAEIQSLPPIDGLEQAVSQERSQPVVAPELTSSEPLTEARVLEALKASRWTIHAAARRLGVPRSTLYSFIDRTRALRKAGDIPEAELRACHAECDGDLEAMMDTLRVSARALTPRLKALGLV